MTNPPTVGQILTDLDDLGQPWTIQSISLHWDIWGVAVIMAKADNSSWIVTDYDIRRKEYMATETYPNGEEATENYCSRAFGI